MYGEITMDRHLEFMATVPQEQLKVFVDTLIKKGGIVWMVYSCWNFESSRIKSIEYSLTREYGTDKIDEKCKLQNLIDEALLLSEELTNTLTSI